MKSTNAVNGKHRRAYQIFLWMILFFSVGTICAIMIVDIYQTVPDTIYLKAGEESELSFHVPLSGEIIMTAGTSRRTRAVINEFDGQQDISGTARSADGAAEKGWESGSGQKSGSGQESGSGQGSRSENGNREAGSKGTDEDAAENGDGKEIDDASEISEADAESIIGRIPVNLSANVTFVANAENSYRAELRLFGLIPFKTVQIEVIDESMVYPAGLPIGIYVKTPGVLVIGTSDFVDEYGNIVMPAEHVLRVGDYILTVNGTQVKGKSDFVSRVAQSGGEVMVMTVERSGEQFDVAVRPVRDQDREYKIGIWIKDSAQGIGTLTYVDADGEFGALGHGVSDSDIGVMLELYDGALYRTDIIGITKGKKGIPGELTGIIRYTDSNRLGSVTENTAAGIHGEVNARLMEQIDSSPVEIGLKQDVSAGPAQIYCNVDGEAKYYDIEIIALDYDSQNVNKGITLQVTDRRLIALTGGIVQGMSGSPIIQNGRLVGAVTHVLVNDPTRGYGIFVEEMLR
ncbi:MAG: SpoIVB peptidase [bacterium]|nr:SpoIVB peptidase [bacterium]